MVEGHRMRDTGAARSPTPGGPAEEPAEPVRITCSDGQVLRGHLVRATGPAAALPVVLAPATGVRQQFYLHFAHWLAGHGHPVLVFDYRGIGQSRDGPLSTCRASLADWGALDQAAALDWLAQHTGAPQVLLLGHSAGGQMLGLLPNHQRVARLVGVSASSGWFGGMPRAFALKARLGLQLLLPLGTRLLGYAPASALGLGEDLPAAVARQWGQWCAAGGYARNAVRDPAVVDFHAQVRTPVTVLHAADDAIATAANVADLLRTWPGAPATTVRVRPADHGLRGLGHLDWFRRSHRSVWPLIAMALSGAGSDGTPAR